MVATKLSAAIIGMSEQEGMAENTADRRQDVEGLIPRRRISQMQVYSYTCISIAPHHESTIELHL